MNKKYIAVVACIAISLMLFAPLASPVNARIPAIMSTIQYRWGNTQDAVFTNLLTPDSQGGVDTMQWPLTHAQYDQIYGTQNAIIEPLTEAGEFELAFNNNWTDGINMDRRSPFNYTDFRNAMNCLTDIDAVITGPTLGGFATHSYTQVPFPLMQDYVPSSVTGSNYPWNFNETKALQILWNGGWYNHAVYPTLASLLTAFSSSALATAGGTGNGVVYSGNDPKCQWGGGDSHATANSGFANAALAQIHVVRRTGDARKEIGLNFEAELAKIGCAYLDIPCASISQVYPLVMDAQTYDCATLGYSMPAPPL